MTTVKVKTKYGKTVFLAKMDDEFKEAVLEGSRGLCIACGAEAYGVEPDARRYECDSCGELRVYGLEELVILGYVR